MALALIFSATFAAAVACDGDDDGGGGDGGAGTECDQATSKLDECNLSDVITFGATCEGVSLCEAKCINMHTCDEIRQALVEFMPNAYSDCDDACQ